MAQSHSLDLEASSSQYASIADGSQTGLDITSDMTVEFWAKFESDPDATDFVPVAKYGGAGSRSYLFQYISGGWRMVNSSDGSAESATGSVVHTITLGRWYFVAITYTASTGTIEVFVDGKSMGTSAGAATSCANTGASFYVGTSTGSGNFFDGLIKDVRIFNDKRTSGEIASDAHTQNVSDANLKGEWNFNNAYTDSSGNSNTLTSSGSPTFSTDIPWEDAPDISGSTYLETNLVSYWTLDEESGTRLDSTANNNDLTDNNTVLFGTGKQSNAADFEAANSEYLSIADASQAGLDVTGDLSISAWIKLEAFTGSETVYNIAAKFVSSGNNRAYRMFVYEPTGTSAGKIEFDWSSDGTTTNMGTELTSSNVIASAGTWYHVVGSLDVSTGRALIYVNGVLAGSANAGASPTSIANTTANFLLGSVETGTVQYFDGLMDEVAIYSRALHYGDVLDLYNAGSGITYAVAASGPANLKSYNTNVKANIKSINTNVIANVKSLNTNA